MSTSSTVTSAELNELLKRDSDPRMIDVRTSAEFETVHTPGAYNVPQDLLCGHRDGIVATGDDDRTQRWDLKSQVRLLAGSLVLCGALRSVAAQTLRWTAARKAR